MLDLHVHSNISDGVFPPEELLLYAAVKGISTLAIADHETIIHYDEYLEHASYFNIDLIPAIEINVSDYKDFHILGYYIKNRKQIEEEILELRKRNQEVCYAVLNSLKKEFGISLSPLKTASYNKDHILDKKAIAKAIIDLGYVDNTKDVYDKYIGPQAKSYIPIEKMDVKKAVKLIHQNGGVAVWAHPYTIKRLNGSTFTSVEFDLVSKKIISYGIDGIEAYTQKHSSEQIFNLRRIATKNSLLITGGSDFHSEKFHQIGCPQLTIEDLNRLKEKASRCYCQTPLSRKTHERD